MTVHQSQYRIATTLQGYMVMGHESTAMGAIVDELITQQVGFQTTDAITLNTLYGIQCLHQVNEPLSCRLTEITDIDTRQDNLLATLTSCFLCLCHQGGDTGITAETAGIGYRAVCAEIVTTVLYFQEITGAVAS